MHIIVGIDPGIKTAFGVIDLNGKIVASGTLKEADVDKVVEEVAKIGIPSAVASDVNPAPSYVLKASARFNVRTFVPPRNMLEREKSEIAPSTENLHERDALSAAIKCYRMYANRLRQIELMDTRLDKDLLKHLVMQGHPLRSATLMLERKDESKLPSTAKPEKSEKRERENELIALSEENVNLKKALDAQHKRNDLLEYEIEKMNRQNYIERGKDSEVRKLRAQVEKMGWILSKLKRKLR